MIAQVGAVMLLQKEEFEGKTAYFTAIKRAKFKDIIRPNDELTIKVSLIKLRNNFGSASARRYLCPGLSGQGTVRRRMRPQRDRQTDIHRSTAEVRGRHCRRTHLY